MFFSFLLQEGNTFLEKASIYLEKGYEEVLLALRLNVAVVP